MPAMPSSIALTSIAVGADILSADHRNNYSAIQTALNAVIAALNVDAKGDLLVATADGTLINVTVGSDGKALVADSTQTSGVKWADLITVYRKTAVKDVVSTVAETDLLNGEITIAAGIMSTNKTLRVKLRGDVLHNNGAGDTCRIKIKLGGTVIYDCGTANDFGGVASATRCPWEFWFDVTNAGAANAQTINGGQWVGPAVAATVGIGTLDNAMRRMGIFVNSGLAIDTATSKLLEVTATWSASSANNSLRLHSALAEVI